MSISLQQESNVSNIKTLAKQMVRKSLGIEDNFDFDLLDLGIEKKDNKPKVIINDNNNLNAKNNNLMKLIPKPKKKKIKRISVLDIPNSDTNTIKTKTIQTISQQNLPESKTIQDGNSNIINAGADTNANTNRNSNINTNQNMTINVNSFINTNNNSNNEINNNLHINNNNNNINDDDIYSNKNSETDDKNNKSKSNKLSSSEIDSDNIENYESNMNENINIDKNTNSNINLNIKINTNQNKNKIKNYNLERSESDINDNKIEKIKDIIVEKIIPSSSGKDNFKKDNKDEINKNNYVNKKSKLIKLSLYEREMRHHERKMKKLEKKRNILKNEEVKELRSKPEIDIYSKIVISNKEHYIPIYQRAVKLHSLKISKQILNEENNKMKKEIEELNILKQYKLRSKIFDQEEWDRFIERQNEWKDEIQYKRKAAEIFRDDINRQYFFKPKINNRSRSIIKDLQDGNDSFIDEVFDRLFNDYEEHKERQKLRNEQSLPSFKPKITKLSKNKSQKLFYRNKKVPYRSSTNPIINIGNNNINKKKYIKNNNSKCNTINKTENNYNKSIKAKSQKLFCDIYNKNVEKYWNIKKSSYNNNNSYNNRQLSSKTQGLTQPTNNTNANYTVINTDLVNSKYIFLENPLITSINNKNKGNQIKCKKYFLPLNIKKMIEKNYEKQENVEDEADNNNYNNNFINKHSNEIMQKKDKKYKNNYYDYNTNEISEKSILEEGQSNFDHSHLDEEEDIKNKNVQNIKDEDKENEDYYNVNIDEMEEEETNKKLPTINESDISIFERKTSFKNIEKNKKYYGQSQNETINTDNSKNIDNNFYKINIREYTPHMIRQDVILPSKDYSDFFDIPDLDDNDF